MSRTVSRMLSALIVTLLSATAVFAQDGHYPVTIQSYNQDGVLVKQTFKAAPKRVVSIGQANTEVLIALGLADRIIATAHRFSAVDASLADRYKAIPFLSMTTIPPREVVIDLAPDLIVGWGSMFSNEQLGPTSDWAARGINTYLLTNTVPGGGDHTLQHLYEDITTLGKIFDIEKKAAALITGMQQRIAAVQEVVGQIPLKDRVRVVTLQYVYENEWLGRGGADLNRNLVELAGGRHLNDNGRQSMEVLVELNPDFLVIIDLSTSPAAGKIAALEANKSLRNIKAIREHHYFLIDHVQFYAGAPRSVDAVEAMARAFYPRLFPAKQSPGSAAAPNNSR
ncbi:MAG: ABC transporter substrate-binding protein [Steroidobacteraceae bacterium]